MRRSVILAAALAVGIAPAAFTQGPPAGGPPLEVGAMAPDFELPGATRYGLLRERIRLSDFHGKTIVIAFFYRARSRG